MEMLYYQRIAQNVRGLLEHPYSGMTEVDLQWLADDFAGYAGNFCHKEEVYDKQ